MFRYIIRHPSLPTTNNEAESARAYMTRSSAEESARSASLALPGSWWWIVDESGKIYAPEMSAQRMEVSA